MTTKHGLMTVCAFVAATAASVAIEPPDSQLNAVSHNIETAISVWSGQDYDVNFVIQHADGTRNVEPVTTDRSNDLAPRIASARNGDAWVVWWNDAAPGEIRLRKRSFADETWGAVHPLSASGEASSAPAIVYDGVAPWVVYAADTGSEQTISAIIITDEPDPIGMRSVVAHTAQSTNPDVDIQAYGGHLWVSWVDEASTVGWSEYERASDTWNAPTFESHAADSVDAARRRIREQVLQP